MTRKQQFYIHYIKRPLGFFGAFMAIIVTSPVWIVTMIVLFFANKNGFKGIFFTQERPGKDEKIFKVIKFKTMTDECDAEGNLLPDAQRLTKVGKFIRSTSIDELPQLINVLKGEMSLIGPRPLTPDYLLVYTPDQARRHEVRPGISGWAQVHGRNLCKLSEKFKMDEWYVDHCTLITDIKIIFLTIWNVINRKDIGAGTGNMEEIDDLGVMEKLRQIERR